MLLSTAKRYMKDPVRIHFLSIKNSGEILDELKARDFSLSTYDCSTLYITIPCNLVKDKIIYLIEKTFQREEALLTLHNFVKCM